MKNIARDLNLAIGVLNVGLLISLYCSEQQKRQYFTDSSTLADCKSGRKYLD